MIYLATDSIGNGFWHYRALLDGGLKFYLGTRITALTVTYLALKE